MGKSLEEMAEFLKIDISNQDNRSFVNWLDMEDHDNGILTDNYPNSLKASWDAALEYASSNRLTTEQKTRLDCVKAVCNCAKELDINCIEQIAFKAQLLMNFVMDGKPIKRV